MSAPLEYSYICAGCAAQRKGEWPDGHRASAHGGKCPYCSQTGMLTAITDWRWPSHIGEVAPAKDDHPMLQMGEDLRPTTIKKRSDDVSS